MTASATSKNTANEMTATATPTLIEMIAPVLATTKEMTAPATSTPTTKVIAAPATSTMTTQAIGQHECLCPCSKGERGKWDFLRGMNLTLNELRKILKPELDLMKKELRINKSNTTRMRRSKISALDDRVSATSVGYAGVVFICLITVIIVCIDMIGCNVTKFKNRS
ncbi:unnamed protein product [Mytilus coruscus]|uniref:Uncharacterized protein n=1 Tax=Mytilus coruscus TaxID=42192 RepID=A0A6J8F4A5_MYTCO|nr:unnamed protein product [Mytilus coruscus]